MPSKSARKIILNKFGNLSLTHQSNSTINIKIPTCLKMKWKYFSTSMDKLLKIWQLIAQYSTPLNF